MISKVERVVPEPDAASLSYVRSTTSRSLVDKMPLLDPTAREESQRFIERVFASATADRPRILAFSGADTGVGCTFVATSIARTLAENEDSRVCLLDGDMRSSSSASSWLLETREVPNSSIGFEPIQVGERLWFQSCRFAFRSDVQQFDQEKLAALLIALKSEFDYVIVDTAPIMRYTETTLISRLVDGLVIVVEAYSSRRHVVRKVAEYLTGTRITCLGAILNNRTFPIPSLFYDRL